MATVTAIEIVNAIDITTSFRVLKKSTDTSSTRAGVEKKIVWAPNDDDATTPAPTSISISMPIDALLQLQCASDDLLITL
jgi:hypothetical protein